MLQSNPSQIYSITEVSPQGWKITNKSSKSALDIIVKRVERGWFTVIGWAKILTCGRICSNSFRDVDHWEWTVCKKAKADLA